MPFLRVIRDKRGYETTYLMHWFRDGSRQYSRILYVFRSPTGVRVGRPALEPDILRQIEAQHPRIEFDWKAVLDNRQVIEPPPEDRRPRKRRREDGEGAPALEAGPRATGQARPSHAPAAPAGAEPRLVVPATIEGAAPDEQIEFLARWHALLTDRIPRHTADAGRQAALLTLAERLNPANWTDADQMTAGLLQAADALERLSHVFARRRRRVRKSGRRPASSEAAAAPEGSEEPDSE